MTLTLDKAPLSTSPPAEANYRIEGPAHKLLLTPFPRRVRAEFGGATILDTTSGALLHESNILPVLYVPEADIATDLLAPTDHSTHCPFKGDASYWSIRVGEEVSENAAWGYPDPLDETVEWLRGKYAFYWDRVDRWFDEDEEVFGHLRDPYHRVDARPSSRGVRVTVNGTVVAESTRPVVLSETGLVNRYYIPKPDVRTHLLSESSTTTHCPYKGQSTYWNMSADGFQAVDVAWSYEVPLNDAAPAKGHLTFDGDGVTVDVM